MTTLRTQSRITLRHLSELSQTLDAAIFAWAQLHGGTADLECEECRHDNGHRDSCATPKVMRVHDQPFIYKESPLQGNEVDHLATVYEIDGSGPASYSAPNTHDTINTLRTSASLNSNCLSCRIVDF